MGIKYLCVPSLASGKMITDKDFRCSRWPILSANVRKSPLFSRTPRSSDPRPPLSTARLPVGLATAETCLPCRRIVRPAFSIRQKIDELQDCPGVLPHLKHGFVRGYCILAARPRRQMGTGSALATLDAFKVGRQPIKGQGNPSVIQVKTALAVSSIRSMELPRSGSQAPGLCFTVQ